MSLQFQFVPNTERGIPQVMLVADGGSPGIQLDDPGLEEIVVPAIRLHGLDFDTIGALRQGDEDLAMSNLEHRDGQLTAYHIVACVGYAAVVLGGEKVEVPVTDFTELPPLTEAA